MTQKTDALSESKRDDDEIFSQDFPISEVHQAMAPGGKSRPKKKRDSQFLNELGKFEQELDLSDWMEIETQDGSIAESAFSPTNTEKKKIQMPYAAK